MPELWTTTEAHFAAYSACTPSTSTCCSTWPLDQLDQPGVSGAQAKKQVYVIYYSTYGHIQKMAETMKAAIDAVEGVEGVMYQVGAF